MSGYTKLFSSILMSSVWEEPVESRIVWVTLLALADQHGHVDGTVKSLARVARVPIQDCQRALDTFLSPDPLDRSGVADGCRIRPAMGGWSLVNYATYRHRMSVEERRERDKLRKRNVRASAERPQASENVRDVSQAEAEAEASTKNVSSAPLRSAEPALLEFATVGRDKAWGLTESRMTGWTQQFPNVDVLAECRKAQAWIEANPERRKTARGMPAFLVNWLNRTVQRGPTKAAATTASGPHEPYHWRDCTHDPKCGTARECADRKAGRR